MNVFGLIGNAVVLLCVIFKSPKLKSLTFKIIGHLAAVDFLTNFQNILMKLSLHFDIHLDILPRYFEYITTIIFAISSAYILVALSFLYFIGFKSAVYVLISKITFEFGIG